MKPKTLSEHSNVHSSTNWSPTLKLAKLISVLLG